MVILRNVTNIIHLHGFYIETTTRKYRLLSSTTNIFPSQSTSLLKHPEGWKVNFLRLSRLICIFVIWKRIRGKTNVVSFRDFVCELTSQLIIENSTKRETKIFDFKFWHFWKLKTCFLWSVYYYYTTFDIILLLKSINNIVIVQCLSVCSFNL